MTPLWTALSCMCSMLLGMTLMYAYRKRLPQHTGAGEGATNVWQLIEHVEAEATRNATPTGKHHLREPREPTEPSAVDTIPIPGPQAPPPLELHHRVLEALHRL
ncbi:hypothetical protein [Saccharopolyspora hattusasensis]|uniref:hypothetical protein n=1 Tax=Saccharopolyspora hattusasensis TaxID=1128679 RepID=UPI003D97A81D